MENLKITCAVQNLLCVSLPSAMTGTVVYLYSCPTSIIVMTWNLYKKNLGEFIHNYNRRCDSEYAVRYLLVPEKHQDGAWHMHGFIKGIRPKDLYTNQYGHLTWKSYEKKFGFISMDKIKDKERASSYILKYMTKDTAHSISELNAHLFYASKKLNRSEEIYRGSGVF